VIAVVGTDNPCYFRSHGHQGYSFNTLKLNIPLQKCKNTFKAVSRQPSAVSRQLDNSDDN
jgi:hypothetical protein